MSLISSSCCCSTLEKCDRKFFYAYSYEVSYKRRCFSFLWDSPSGGLQNELLEDEKTVSIRAYQSGFAYFGANGKLGSSSMSGPPLCGLDQTTTGFEATVRESSVFRNTGEDFDVVVFSIDPNQPEFTELLDAGGYGGGLQEVPPYWAGRPFIVPEIRGFYRDGLYLARRGGPSLEFDASGLDQSFYSKGAYRPYDYCGYYGFGAPSPVDFEEVDAFTEDYREELRNRIFAAREHNAYRLSRLYGNIQGAPFPREPTLDIIPLPGYEKPEGGQFGHSPVKMWEYRKRLAGTGTDEYPVGYGYVWDRCRDQCFARPFQTFGQSPLISTEQRILAVEEGQPGSPISANLGQYNCIADGPGSGVESYSPGFWDLKWGDELGVWSASVQGPSGSYRPNTILANRGINTNILAKEYYCGGDFGPEQLRSLTNGCDFVYPYDSILSDTDPMHFTNLENAALSQMDAYTTLAPPNGGLNFADSGKMITNVRCDPVSDDYSVSTCLYERECTGRVEMVITPIDYDWEGTGRLCPDSDWDTGP